MTSSTQPPQSPSPPNPEDQRGNAIRALLTIIKSAELYVTRNGRVPEGEGLATNTGINSLVTLGVTPEEMREQIRKLGW